MVIVNNGNNGNLRVVHGDGDGVQNQEIGKVVSQNRITSIAVVESY